jgi:hypothetical protein
MSWAKLSGDYPFHRKVLLVGNEGAGAHVRMIAWSAENLTGGRVSRAAALAIAAQPLIDRLVEVGLLDVDGDGWAVHDYADHNPTGEDLAARRAELKAKRAEYGRRGAAALWGKRDGKGDGKPNGNLPGKADGKNMATSPFPSPSPVSVPAHPSGEGSLSLVPTEPTVSERSKKKPSRVPSSDASAAEVEAWCAKWGIPSPSTDDDVAAMLDHWRANANSPKAQKSDWAAALRTWKRNETKFAGRTGTAKVHNPPQGRPAGGSAWSSLAKKAGVQ